MSIENRETILEGLNNNLSFSKISKLINKDRTTISKEIKKHRILHESKDPLRKKCAKLNSCSITGLCPYVNCHNKLCKTCNQCSSICTDFVLDICERLVKPPYVCNGCPTRTNCHKPIKYFYKPSSAQHEYEHTLSSSREGIGLTPVQLEHLDNLVSPLILENGQHLNHIYINHENEIPISMRTIYDYINKGYLRCKNIDLPKKVSYKARKTYPKRKINSSKLRINHTYNDYLTYMKQHPDSHVVQIDTVEGLKGESLLLTMHAVKENFQIAHLIKNKESQNIIMIFELYRERINDDELFVRFFNVILTDNGSEFSDILSLEKMGIHVFFVIQIDQIKKEHAKEIMNISDIIFQKVIHLQIYI